ncbi:pentapeptide repeat-containing protein [Hymenobacter aerilatus]|uniref:Pentapeptide repeat-containing protein n=1 Tax=Hymenobacter aerilatus TaxID=2932251 RepID=A0A8T9SUR6_9BACT|nr:pentapeptide repeat-containing protein [Hymenobacter aerilatus]UOR05111.1 pentapeptide repeat-containing protein [Hymenobacter aerilatus]
MKKSPASKSPTVYLPENTFARWTADQLRTDTEWEQCLFVDCNFAEADLRHKRFIDCRFERCNFTLATLNGVGLQGVAFAECKLTGVQFATCQDMLFRVDFEQCQLHYASFAGKKMRGTSFRHCSCTEADFTQADLSNAAFAHTALSRTVFHHTQLNGADFTTATDFIIDPEHNPLRGARFTVAGLVGLVAKYDLVIE